MIFKKTPIQVFSCEFRQIYQNIFFLNNIAGWLVLLNSLYSLRRPQPQNVTLDLVYPLMIIHEHFQSKYCKYCKSFRAAASGSSRLLIANWFNADQANDAFRMLLKLWSSRPAVLCIVKMIFCNILKFCNKSSMVESL